MTLSTLAADLGYRNGVGYWLPGRAAGLMLFSLAVHAQPAPPVRRLPIPDKAVQVTADRVGNLYFVGQTDEALPVTPGAFQTEYKPCLVRNTGPGATGFRTCGWAFAGKMTPEGTLIYLTYLAGVNGISLADLVQVDADGNAYITGGYESRVGAVDFPTTSGAWMERPEGGVGTFLLKLDPSGSRLVYSTFVGGGRAYTQDWGSLGELVIDPSGAAWFTVLNASRDLPVRNAIPNTAAVGIARGYVGKLSPSGTELEFGSYLNVGEGGRVVVRAGATDGEGSLYVFGGCFWDEAATKPCVPVTSGAFQTIMKGQGAGFVMKFSSQGVPIFSTLLSGAEIRSLALDRDGGVVVSGSTFRPRLDLV